MGKVTYVVEYEEGKEPSVHGDMEVTGGRLTSVLWSDYRDDHLLSEELEIIGEAMNMFPFHKLSNDSLEKIMNKLRLMTQ